jgi:hypothetical protein
MLGIIRAMTNSIIFHVLVLPDDDELVSSTIFSEKTAGAGIKVFFPSLRLQLPKWGPACLGMGKGLIENNLIQKQQHTLCVCQYVHMLGMQYPVLEGSWFLLQLYFVALA